MTSKESQKYLPLKKVISSEILSLHEDEIFCFLIIVNIIEFFKESLYQ